MQKDNEQAINYDVALKIHNDRYYQGTKNTRLWQTIAVLGFVFGTGSLGYAAWISFHNTLIPYVVLVDKIGNAALAEPIKSVKSWPERVIKRELIQFVENIRSISSDRDVIEKRFKKAFALLQNSSPAFGKIKAVFREKENNPFNVAETRTTSVEVTSINKSTSLSYIVVWTETYNKRQSGQTINTQKFSGTITLGDSFILTKEKLDLNPLALHIADIDFIKVF